MVVPHEHTQEASPLAEALEARQETDSRQGAPESERSPEVSALEEWQAEGLAVWRYWGQYGESCARHFFRQWKTKDLIWREWPLKHPEWSRKRA